MEEVCFVILTVMIVVHGARLGNEPQCSKFHYEEQLLEKMIRMEVKVEAMEKRILQTNQNVLDALDELKEERVGIKKEYEELQNQNTKEMEKRIADITKLKDTLLQETIAFKARGPVDKSLDTGQTIVFAETMFNYGEAYDNITGIFVVPVSGTYLFTIHLCIRNKKNMYYGIVVDKKVQTSGVFYDQISSHCSSADAIVVLKGGERVHVKCVYTSSGDVLFEYSSSSNNYWNTFSGVLIHK